MSPESSWPQPQPFLYPELVRAREENAALKREIERLKALLREAMQPEEDVT